MSFAAEPVSPAGCPSLGALLYEALLQFKSQTALLEASRKRENHRWTYLETLRLARRVTQRMAKLQIGADDRVGVVLTNQSRYLISALAIFFRGAVLVPIDHKLTGPEQQTLLKHAGCKLVITEWGFRRTWDDDVADHLWLMDPPAKEGLGDAFDFHHLPADPGTVDLVPRQPSDLATIVYSSGTSGTPKGCRLSHRAYLSQLEGLLERFPMQPGDVYFSILPTNHAIDFMVGFVGPFCCGAAVLHQRTLRPELLRWTMRHYGPTHMSVVPMVLSSFVSSVKDKMDEVDGWQRTVLDSLVGVNRWLSEKKPQSKVSQRLLKPVHQAFGGRLKLVVCGGAFTPQEDCDFMYELGIPVVIGYGLTEACTAVCVNRLTPYRADSVGDPLKHVQVKIHDPDKGGVGEVWVAGPTLFDGYLDAPELTAEAMEGAWLKTGDLGWLDASDHLHLVGRTKDVIVTAGGKNVYPQDVEHAFADVPAEELAVFSYNALLGERSLSTERLVLVVRSEEDVHAALVAANRHLSDYKRVSDIIRVDLEFPRTASMKVKRNLLAARVAEMLQNNTVAVEPLA